MKTVKCAECSELFGLSPETQAVFLRSSQTFYCPFGHGNVYSPKPSEAETLRRERDRLKQESARLAEMVRAAENSAAHERARASAFKGQTTKLKKRIAAGVCPCCNRTFSNLARHISSQHPDILVASEA